MAGQPPSPEDGVERLRFMLGTFEGEERAAGGRRSRGQLVAVEAVGGRAVVSDYVQWVGSEAVFWGHGVYAFDDLAHQYVMTWFDSEGGGRAVRARGVFEGSRLTFEADGERGRSRYVYDVGASGYGFSIQVSSEADAWQVVLEASYKRA